MYMEHWGPGGDFFIHNAGLLVPGLMLALAPFVLIFVLWSVVWKGLALWHAARRGQPWWFVILLVVNTAGILEIIYLFLVAKLKLNELFSKHDHHA